MDMPWLFDGALNMARPAVKGKINTLVISGGTGFMIGDAINVAALQKVTKPGQVKVVAPQSPTAWSIKSEDETIFELIASEKFDIDGTKVAVKHYSTSDGEKLGGLWVTDSGLLTKMVVDENSNFILSSFKQYKKIIPELPVAPNAPRMDTSKQTVAH